MPTSWENTMNLFKSSEGFIKQRESKANAAILILVLAILGWLGWLWAAK
jgi:hypothetical protein